MKLLLITIVFFAFSCSPSAKNLKAPPAENKAVSKPFSDTSTNKIDTVRLHEEINKFINKKIF